MKIKRRGRLEIKVRKKKRNNGEGSKVAVQSMDRLTSPCRGCGNESKDKRENECGVCPAPHDYAMAVEKVYSHLPSGIDTQDIHSSTNGRVKSLSEVWLTK